MYISIAHLNHAESSPHRYQHIEDHYTSLNHFTNARMIKNNVLRINTTIESIITANFGYYTFSNDGTGKKYYFFILSYDYINDTTIEVSISIDWFYTDFDNLTLKNSLIERIHPKTFDEDYSNTVENIATGEIVKDLHKVFTPSTSFKYVMGLTRTVPTHIITPYIIGLYNDIFPVFGNGLTTILGSPSNCVYYVLDDLATCEIVWHNCVTAGVQDCIKYFNLVPDNLINTTQNMTFSDKANHTFTVQVLNSTSTLLQASQNGTSLFNIAKPEVLQGYRPVYKKVLSSQFCNIILQTSNTCKEYDIEQFDGSTCDFKIYYTNSPDCTMYIVPSNYGGVTFSNFVDSTNLNGSINGILTTTTTDSLIADLITGDVTSTIKNAPHILGVIGKMIKEAVVNIAAKGNPTTAAASEVLNEVKQTFNIDTTGATGLLKEGIQGLFNDGAEFYSSPLRGGEMSVGTFNSSVPNIALPDNSRDVYLGYATPRIDDLKRADRYFSRFGYNKSDIIIPYFRDTYTFIKGDLNFFGSTNDISTQYIHTLFQNGVTIWNNNDLYNYDVNMGD